MAQKTIDNRTIEQRVIELIARDRIEIPLSSLYQKVKRVKKKDAEVLGDRLYEGKLEGEFESERVFAYVADEDVSKARGMKAAVADFSAEYPKYGKILADKIAEQRTSVEKHVYFGVNTGSRLTTDDYIAVMKSLGMTDASARSLYPDLLKVSRKLANAREEDRRVIIGKYSDSSDESEADEAEQ